jgi:hypothetical protein
MRARSDEPALAANLREHESRPPQLRESRRETIQDETNRTIVLSDKSTARDEAKIVPISKSLDTNADSQALNKNLFSSERKLWKELHPICNLGFPT